RCHSARRVGTMGQDRSTCTPNLVVLIITWNRAVFRREFNTESSRRGHKRELASHTSVTSSSCLKTHAMERRSEQVGKSRCLSVCVTVGRCQPCMAGVHPER